MRDSNASASTVVSRTLHQSPGLTCRLVRYGPGQHQRRHAHASANLSLVLAGTLQETVGSQEVWANSGSLSAKPADVRHSNVYGDRGALLLAVTVEDPELWAEAAPREGWAWSRVSAEERTAILGALRRGGGWCEADEVFDLLALAGSAPARRSSPPAWLQEVAARLTEDGTAPISKIAADAGVHPVYLARAFRQWFRTTPKGFRLWAKTSVAVDHLLGGTNPARAAQESGFADQSHMCRSLRAATGSSPRELVELFAPGPMSAGSPAPTRRRPVSPVSS